MDREKEPYFANDRRQIAYSAHDITDGQFWTNDGGARDQRAGRLGRGLARQIEKARRAILESSGSENLSGEFRLGHLEQQIESD